MPSYLDTVNADGSYNLRVILDIARENTKAQIARDAQFGIPMSYFDLLLMNYRLACQSARSIRASLIAGRENSEISPLERRARRLELAAEKAESQIPSCPNFARDLRSRALRLRLEAPVQLEAAE